MKKASKQTRKFKRGGCILNKKCPTQLARHHACLVITAILVTIASPSAFICSGAMIAPGDVEDSWTRSCRMPHPLHTGFSTSITLD